MGTALGIGIGIPFTRRSGGGVANTARTQAFLTATGITDATIISALNAMDLALISAGLLPSGTGAGKIKALYPIVGGSATAHKYNFVDPRDLDAAFRMNFFGGWTHTANGAAANGTNANANSYFQMTSSFQNNVHWYVYQRFAAGNGSPSIVANPNSNNINFYTNFNSELYARLNGAGGPHGSSASPIKGFFASRLNSSDILVGKDGTYTTYAQTSAAPNNEELYLGGNGNIGWSDNEFAFFTLGEGLTNSEGISLNSACVTFQTTLGRNV
jgi:hypothetical protein